MERQLIKVNLRGKIALVTGGARGIGAAISTALAENGAVVVVNYLSSEERAKELAERIQRNGGKALVLKADIAVKEEVELMVSKAKEALDGTIDILVNNAGTQVALSAVEEMPLELWNKALAINLTGPMLCCRCVIPGMKEKGWGRIINISSISARTGGGPGGAHYASTKGGLGAFTKGLAKELAPFGITVNAVAPGVILTEQHEKFSTKKSLEFIKKQTPLGRLGQPEDVSGAVLFLVSDSASYITGETIAVNGGLRMD